MSRPLLAVLALATVASLTPPARAAEGDSVLGNLLSRVAGTREAAAETPRVRRAVEQETREREARDLRRSYWERERARIAEQAAARQTVASTTR